jgi:hypothetical protein
MGRTKTGHGCIVCGVVVHEVKRERGGCEFEPHRLCSAQKWRDLRWAGGCPMRSNFIYFELFLLQFVKGQIWHMNICRVPDKRPSTKRSFAGPFYLRRSKVIGDLTHFEPDAPSPLNFCFYLYFEISLSQIFRGPDMTHDKWLRVPDKWPSTKGLFADWFLLLSHAAERFTLTAN